MTVGKRRYRIFSGSRSPFEAKCDEISNKLNAGDIQAADDRPKNKVMKKRMVEEFSLGFNIRCGGHRIQLGENRVVRAHRKESGEDAD